MSRCLPVTRAGALVAMGAVTLAPLAAIFLMLSITAPVAAGPFEGGWSQAGAPQTLVPRDREQPSFDCSKARTAAARLICADGELARLAGELGKAFQNRKALLSPDEASAFVSDELAWIRDRNTHCDLVGKNDAAIEELASSKPCMVSAIQKRIAYLAQTEATAAPVVPDGPPLQIAPPSEAQSVHAGPQEALPSVAASRQFEDERTAEAAEQGNADAQKQRGPTIPPTPAPKVPSIDDYSRGLAAGYTPDEIRESVAKESGLTGDDLAKEFAKLDAAVALQLCPTISPPPVPGSYNPEDEQTSLRKVQGIEDPRLRLRTEQYIKQEYANRRMMGEINEKAAVGEYLHAIRQIRDDPKASWQVKERCVKKLIDTMWNDPRLKYGDTAGKLEKAMQTLAGVDDTTDLGPGYRSPAEITPGSRSPKKPRSEATSGTAFFVSKEGTAVTNAHVVESCQHIRVSINGQQGTARVVASDEKNDLALLATDLKPIQSANWRLSVRQGEDIVAYGFPLTEVLASGGNVVVGNVTALAGLGNDSRFLQISAPVQPGNSGGPLLDRAGNVVGIVVAKLNAIGVASVTGDIPQNVNFAIKASVAAAFLDAQRVVHAEGQDTASLSTPNLSERAKAFTAQVVCVQ